MARTTSKSQQVDSLGNTQGSDVLAGFQNADYEDTANNSGYYGFIDTQGNWYIRKMVNGSSTYSRGTTNYAANWAGRAGLTYTTFEDTF